jgi:hypothetical protein
MPYDLTKTHYSLSLQKNVAAGSVVDREGVLLQAVLEGGEDVVKKAEESTGLNLVGFAVSDNETIGIIPVVEDLVVPAAPGPYTVQLAHASLVGTAPNSSVRVEDITASADLTEENTGTPASGEFFPNVATGLLTFHVDEAAHVIRVYYRANLTVAESRQRFFQRNINNEAGAIFNTIVAGGGVGEIYTAEYDTNVDWSAATSIKSAADGLLSDHSGGGTVLSGGRVIHVPDPDGPYLGVSFSLPG